jgi:hypothetical protein
MPRGIRHIRVTFRLRLVKSIKYSDRDSGSFRSRKKIYPVLSITFDRLLKLVEEQYPQWIDDLFLDKIETPVEYWGEGQRDYCIQPLPVMARA